MKRKHSSSQNVVYILNSRAFPFRLVTFQMLANLIITNTLEKKFTSIIQKTYQSAFGSAPPLYYFHKL